VVDPRINGKPDQRSVIKDGSPAPIPHVLVIGAGFGGLSVVQSLHRTPVQITVIDQRNHHLFQPLLYQLATAGLSPAEIAAPIRSIVGRMVRVTVMLGEVFAIDTAQRLVQFKDTAVRRLSYDLLVVATGSRHSYFGHDEWAGLAPGLKTVEDATFIRRRILLAFERAETEPDPVEQARLLTFVIVGGGPTGVEMAGAVSELARRILARDFRRIHPPSARIVLIEAGRRLLPAFAEDLSAYALNTLKRLGVEVRLGAPVTSIEPDCVRLGEERLETRTAIWAAGVQASEAARWLGVEADRVGRVKVTDRLTLPQHPEIFVIGDTALVQDAAGRPVPGLAPAAKEQGRYVAYAIKAGLKDRPTRPFRYRHLGNLATIGRRSAVIEFGRFRLSGFLAWLLWGAAHIFFLIGFRNRIVVTIDWLWSYLRFGGGARLITGIKPE
jgi:NADH:ubiquinone reductase (H+-translocating)